MSLSCVNVYAHAHILLPLGFSFSRGNQHRQLLGDTPHHMYRIRKEWNGVKFAVLNANGILNNNPVKCFPRRRCTLNDNSMLNSPRLYLSFPSILD